VNVREWNAEEYNRLSEPQHAWGVKVVNRLQGRDLNARSRVLDAGCGTGRVTAELMLAFPETAVTGIDLSRNMLETARENLCSKFGTRIAFVCADLQQLPFTTAFQIVFSTASFHWVKDHQRLFDSIYNALVPGGWLIAQCGGGPNLKTLRDRGREIQSRPEFTGYFVSWTDPWEYADEPTTSHRLKKAGFTDVHVWLEEEPTVLPDESTYRAFLANVTLHRQLACIPDLGARNAFLDLVVERAGGKWTLDYWRLNIDARKPL
jgi:trans-aconitate 2-methyltransferase